MAPWAPFLLLSAIRLSTLLRASHQVRLARDARKHGVLSLPSESLQCHGESKYSHIKKGCYHVSALGQRKVTGSREALET